MEKDILENVKELTRITKIHEEVNKYNDEIESLNKEINKKLSSILKIHLMSHEDAKMICDLYRKKLSLVEKIINLLDTIKVEERSGDVLNMIEELNLERRRIIEVLSIFEKVSGSRK